MGNDLDPAVAAYWRTVCGLQEDFEKFLESCRSLVPTRENFYKMKDEFKPKDDVERAVRFFALNKWSFSGNLKSTRKAVGEHWKLPHLDQKLRAVRKLLAGRLTIHEMHFREFLLQIVPRDYAVYADPPYVKAGPKLYELSLGDSEHAELRNALARRENWVLSYDRHPTVGTLYGENSLFPVKCSYSLYVHASGSGTQREVVIVGRGWAREMLLIVGLTEEQVESLMESGFSMHAGKDSEGLKLVVTGDLPRKGPRTNK